MSYNSLKIKDGNGDLKSVAAVSSSDGFYPVHVIDPDHAVVVKSSETERVWVTGNVLVSNFSNSTTVTNFPTIYTVTSSNNNPVLVSGSINVANLLNNLSVSSSNTNPIVEQKVHAVSISENMKYSYSWNTSASGTFQLLDLDTSRKEIIIQNDSPRPLYVKLSSVNQNDSTKHGFILNNTASFPLTYNFIVYPSGTYISSDPSRVLYHGGYFISSSATGTIVATSIS